MGLGLGTCRYDILNKITCTLVVELSMQAIFIELIAPFRHNQCRHAITDRIGQCARFRHEAINTQDQRETGYRHMTNRRQGRRQNNEATAGNPGGAF